MLQDADAWAAVQSHWAAAPVPSRLWKVKGILLGFGFSISPFTLS